MDGQLTRYAGFGEPPDDGTRGMTPVAYNTDCHCPECEQARATEIQREQAEFQALSVKSDRTMDEHLKASALGFALWLGKRPAPLWKGLRGKDVVVVCPFGNGDVTEPVLDEPSGNYWWSV